MRIRVTLTHPSGSQISSAAFEIGSEATEQDALTEGLKLLELDGVEVADPSQWEAAVHKMWPTKE